MASYFDPIDINLFNLGDLSTFQSRDVTESIVNFNVSLSLQGSSQVSVTVLDPAFTFARANYFQVRRDIFYRNLWFEISAVSTQRSQAIHPEYEIECRSKAVQLMKRDKRPEAYRGMSAYEFAFTIAKRFGMNFIGEQTTKKPAVVKGKTKNSDDSVWTVLTSLASEQQFICFESENTLFFCSEKFLLGKWGDPNYAYGDFKFIPFFYPDSTDPVFAAAQERYVLLEQPSLRRSDDDINAADGSMMVDRFNGVNLRPGMTIFLGGIPDFEAFYIITDVSFSEGSNEPVQVQFRLPVDPSKEKISTSTAQGSSPTTGSRGSNPIGNSPGFEQLVARDKPISPQDSRAYSTSALARLRYRGSNANLIKQAVEVSVRLYNAGSSVESILKVLRSDNRFSNQEKDYAESIFVSYVANKPVTTLGVSGGLSTTAVQETADQLERQRQTNLSNPTPSTSATTSSILQAPKLTDATKNLINQYIDSKAAGRGSSVIAAHKKFAIQRAEKIIALTSKQAKQAEFKKARNDWSASGDRVKYDAITQTAVLNAIATGWNRKSDGTNFDIQIARGW